MRVRVPVLRPVIGSALLVCMLVLAVPSMSDAGTEATTHVHIQNVAFNPETVTVLVGETVEWDNHDAVPHTVSADGGSFDSGTLGNGQTFDFTFQQTGIFGYHCQIHGGQIGTVVVVNPSELPDLVISGLEDEDVVPGVQKDVHVTARNIGGSPAGPTTTLLTYLYSGDAHEIGTLDVPPLAVGETFTATVSWVTLGLVGDFVVVAHANADGAQDESDTTNNDASATVSVLVSGIDGVDLTNPA